MGGTSVHCDHMGPTCFMGLTSFGTKLALKGNREALWNLTLRASIPTTGDQIPADRAMTVMEQEEDLPNIPVQAVNFATAITPLIKGQMTSTL